MRVGKSKQFEFFSDRGEESPEHIPTEEDEREIFRQKYGEGAEEAPLTKGEAIGKSRKKKKIIEGIITRGRKKIGIHRKGDQEEIL